MGWTYEVNRWVEFDDSRYGYEILYCGESLIKAMVVLLVAKKLRKEPCVKFEWR